MKEQKIKLSNSIELNVIYQIEHKPTVLFLHFSGGTSKMWNGVLPLFKKDFSIIAPDFRGHGKSERPLTGYHIDDMANDLYLLLKELNIEKCHVVGSSLGAEVGLSLARAHPRMVLSLVCEGALANEFGEFGIFNGTEEEIDAEKDKINQILMERKLPNHQTKIEAYGEMKESFQQQGFWNEYFSSFIESCIEETEEGTFTSHYKNHVRIEYIQKYWELKFEEYYKNIACPILFLPSTEEWDNEKVRKSLESFISYLQDSYEIKHLKDSAHAYVWMQQPREASEVVKEFISKYQR
ncbi:alpha/beta fold hydrolase [Cytobacillus sp. FJAT-54145]|uniref:Alpha/beta fold hydrolase n=1 Tax=Cytobacillus spartinae TaxID=3299023 RepID=A0ABW6K951_9BACI